MNRHQTISSRHAPAGVSRWRPGAISGAEIALIGPDDVRPIIPGVDLWDCWPLAREDGSTVEVDGSQFWFFLSAPCFPDPVERHGFARIRLAALGPDGWRDLGNCLPDGFSPGSREWAGSALLDDDGIDVTLFFTAAGRRGEGHSFEQRLFAARGRLGPDGPGEWQTCSEVVRPDGARYFVAAEAEGTPGLIKGFRDPAWLRDPATGLAHLLFTGTAGWDDAAFNGLIGLATRDADGTWHLENPLVEAIGVNNELERPHVLVRDGRYYLFWSTQRRTFDPAVPGGPNGLYCMVADRLTGPYRPVNGDGLVAGNPVGEPTQGYSWWVTGEGAVWSFVDHWGLEGRNLADHPELLRRQFGGTPAPVFHLAFSGDSVTIA